MRDPAYRTRPGFSLIELIIAIAILAIPIAAVTVLLSGSSRAWKKIYDDANSEIRLDSLATMTSLQHMGRQANIVNYTVYTINNGAFTPAVPLSGEDVAEGQAVEFRYWRNAFDPANPPSDVFEFANTGDGYALYYLDNKTLKLDLGRIVNGVGAINNNSRQTANLDSTQILSENVDTSETTAIFSHQTSGGQGSGCINTNLTLTNDAGKSIEVKFATLLRAAWPR
jgi:prepilin-type N-terminal cleavage/methylation domain-containing protein